MQIGAIIKENRKAKHMTQEEMAKRLGVTTPAVNKWENGNSMPDITLLAPIARLLGITLDTLLSYQESITDEDAQKLINEANDMFKKGLAYDDVFQWAKKCLETYPNCEHLTLWMALLLDGKRLFSNTSGSENYDEYINGCYKRVLGSSEEETRTAAANALFSYYMRKDQYDKAEECLSYFSIQNPERKLKQSRIYIAAERWDDACRTLEELLFQNYNFISAVFHHIYLMAMKEENWKKAHLLAQKQNELANLFEMGEYHAISPGLDLAVNEKDGDKVLKIMDKMLQNLDSIYAFSQSNLYEHMTFKTPEKEYLAELRENLINNFKDEESFGFLGTNETWNRKWEDILLKNEPANI